MTPNAPFTDWDAVPLYCGVSDVARVFNRSTKWILRRLKAGTMTPAPLPRASSREPWTWRKETLQAFDASLVTGPKVSARHYFEKAQRRRQALSLTA